MSFLKKKNEYLYAEKIKKKLKPEEVKIETFSFQEYPALNIIPLYKETPLQKYKAEETELKQMQKKSWRLKLLCLNQDWTE